MPPRGRPAPPRTRRPAIGAGRAPRPAIERVRRRRRRDRALDLQPRPPRVPPGRSGALGKNDRDVEVVAREEPHLLERAVFALAPRALLLVHLHRVAVPRLRVQVKGVGQDRHVGQIAREDRSEVLGLEAATAPSTCVRVHCAEGVFCEGVLEVGVVGRGDGA